MTDKALECKHCGAVWLSPAAHELAAREGGCLSCGGPLVATPAPPLGETEAPPADRPPE